MIEPSMAPNILVHTAILTIVERTGTLVIEPVKIPALIDPIKDYSEPIKGYLTIL